MYKVCFDYIDQIIGNYKTQTVFITDDLDEAQSFLRLCELSDGKEYFIVENNV